MRWFRSVVMTGALSAMSTVTASAQDAEQLGNLRLEDLASIQVATVFGASERVQPVTNAPSSVTIVTADEIRRYGYRTLADILGGVRGLYVTNDRNYSYLGSRGFATAGDYNTRILLLLNGQRLNDSVYGQAMIGGELGLDPAMFERVEIVRGPASSLYGTGAFFAVVNLITRTGRELNGALVDLDAGTLGTYLTRAAFGRRLANGVDVMTAVSYEQSDGVGRLIYPEFSDANGGVAEHLDGEVRGTAFAQMRTEHFTLTGAFGRRRRDIPTASFDTVFNAQDPRERTTDGLMFVGGQYGRGFAGTRLEVSASAQRARYSGVYPFASENPDTPFLVQQDEALGAFWTASAHLSRTFAGRHTITVGADVLDHFRQNQWWAYNEPGLGEMSSQASLTQAGLFAQGEITVRPWLLLNLGARYDRYSTLRHVSPRAAVIVAPSPKRSFKYVFGDAFRAPNAYELYYYTDTVPDLAPESIATHEVVWEEYYREWLRTSVSAYWYRLWDLIALETFDAPSGSGEVLGFVNQGGVRARGVEFEAELRLKSGIQGFAAYALQRASDRATDVEPANSPRHLMTFRFSVPMPSRAIASVELRGVSSRQTLAGNRVPAYAAANVTVDVPLGRSVKLYGRLRNLFDRRFSDPGSAEHRQDAIEQNGRTASIGLRWTWSPRRPAQ